MTQCVADEMLGRFARQQHDWFERVRKGSLDPDAVMRLVQTMIDSAYPATGEIFELTLDGDDPVNNPIEMVRRDGYDNPSKWKHNGPTVKGTKTGHFKLVEIGYQPSFDVVCRVLKKHGKIPEGQWREAFKAKYLKPDGRGPIGIADASWVNPDVDADFPCVHTDGNSNFRWTDSVFSDGWRWLVGVSK